MKPVKLYEIEACAKLINYCIFSNEKTQNMKRSDIEKGLLFFYTKSQIEEAWGVLLGSFKDEVYKEDKGIDELIEFDSDANLNPELREACIIANRKKINEIIRHINKEK